MLVNKEPNAPKNIINSMNEFFEKNNLQIKVQITNEIGEPTLEEQTKIFFQKQLNEISTNPIIKEIFSTFKNYTIEKIETL